MGSWTQTHPTVPLTTPVGTVVEIDAEMAPFVRELWRLGYITRMCCQDAGEAIIGGGLTHVHASLRDTTAARNMGRALLKVAAIQGPALLTALRSLHGTGLWLANIPMGLEGPSPWASIAFPRNHILLAAALLGTCEVQAPRATGHNPGQGD
jgi:hypothetical protein